MPRLAGSRPALRHSSVSSRRRNVFLLASGILPLSSWWWLTFHHLAGTDLPEHQQHVACATWRSGAAGRGAFHWPGAVCCNRVPDQTARTTVDCTQNNNATALNGHVAISKREGGRQAGLPLLSGVASASPNGRALETASAGAHMLGCLCGRQECEAPFSFAAGGMQVKGPTAPTANGAGRASGFCPQTCPHRHRQSTSTTTASVGSRPAARA